MNAAHFHLIFNHLPIISPILGILVLSLGYILGSAIIKRTALFIFILGSLLSKIPLDPKIQALIDQGKSIFEEYK
jgi:hypothetical protein